MKDRKDFLYDYIEKLKELYASGIDLENMRLKQVRELREMAHAIEAQTGLDYLELKLIAEMRVFKQTGFHRRIYDYFNTSLKWVRHMNKVNTKHKCEIVTFKSESTRIKQNKSAEYLDY